MGAGNVILTNHQPSDNMRVGLVSMSVMVSKKIFLSYLEVMFQSLDPGGESVRRLWVYESYGWQCASRCTCEISRVMNRIRIFSRLSLEICLHNIVFIMYRKMYHSFLLAGSAILMTKMLEKRKFFLMFAMDRSY